MSQLDDSTTETQDVIRVNCNGQIDLAWLKFF